MDAVKDLVAVYFVIGILVTSALFLSADVRSDAAKWEKFYLLSFLGYMVFTWPSTVYFIVLDLISFP